MLRVADQGVIDSKEKRGAILKANEGQAALLIEAAKIADEMLAALQMVRDANGDNKHFACESMTVINAAIARATGAAP